MFNWTNISGVQDVVSGAMSGLSAYIGWAMQNNSDQPDKDNKGSLTIPANDEP